MGASCKLCGQEPWVCSSRGGHDRRDMPCEPDDVIVEPPSAENGNREHVGRCHHGTTSQGVTRAHACEMTVEACEIARRSEHRRSDYGPR